MINELRPLLIFVSSEVGFGLAGFLLGRFVLGVQLRKYAHVPVVIVARLVAIFIVPLLLSEVALRAITRHVTSPGQFGPSEIINAVSNVGVLCVCVLIGYTRSIVAARRRGEETG